MTREQYDYKNEDDTRWHFYESWLQEMPQRIEARNDFPGLSRDLNDFVNRNGEDLISNDIYISQSANFIYVYGKVQNEISIITYLEKNRQSAFVLNTQKNSKFSGQRPSAVDLYLATLNAISPVPLIFTSDNKMTDLGLGIWKKMFKLGKHISVYDVTDKSRAGKTLISIETESDFEKYFGDSVAYNRYRYVLSESVNYYGHVYERFMMRRICESAGTINDDIYEEEDK